MDVLISKDKLSRGAKSMLKKPVRLQPSFLALGSRALVQPVSAGTILRVYDWNSNLLLSTVVVIY